MSAAGWIIMAMSLVLSGAFMLIAIAWVHIVSLRDAFDEQHDANHAKCIAHIADVVSKRVVAMAFRDAAVRWDSVEEKPNLTRLARKEYKTGGPSMPNLWLNQQADLLDPTPTGGVWAIPNEMRFPNEH